MAKKPTVTTITSGYASNTQLNANFVALRDGFDNTLSLDGSTPNSMGAALDMNGNDILNGGTIAVADLTVAGLDMNTALNSAVSASAASAVASDVSAVASAASAGASEASAVASAASAALSGDASGTTYTQGGTGSVETTVEAKLRESVSVKDFGAVGDGVTDDTAAFLASAKASSSAGVKLFVPVGTYLISAGINGTTDGVSYLDIEMDHNAVIHFDDTSGGFDWLTDIDELFIKNGSIGRSGNEIAGNYGFIRYTANKTELYIENVDFDGGSVQQHCIYSNDGTGPNKVTALKCDFRNFLHEAFEVYASTEGNTESKFLVDNCYFKNMGSLGSNQTARAILFGSNNSRIDNIVVRNNRIWRVHSAGTGATNGILLYGNSVLVDGNHVEGVYNVGGDDAEGIYVKATNARIVNNYVLNGGNSHDGCINIKGSNWDGGAQEAGYSVIANNCIELTDTTLDVPAITINKSRVICSNNILKDLRTGRAAKTLGYALGVGTSSYVRDVIVQSNIITGFKNFFSNDDVYRSNSIHNVLIKDNICTHADGGVVISTKSDAKIAQTMTFTASTNTISIDGNASEIPYDMYRVGDSITVNATVSNNGTYTVASVSQYSLTVTSGITDETSVANAALTLDIADGLRVTGNVFSFENQGAYGWYHRSGSFKYVQWDNNIFENINRGIRSTVGTHTRFDLRNNIFQSVVDEVYTSISATDVYREANSSGVTGGAGSASAGAQYVEVTVDGVTYKVLHDGTV